MKAAAERSKTQHDAESAAALLEERVAISSDGDIVKARQKGRELALQVGFQGTEPTLIAAAISEVARNIIQYAKRGEILIQSIENDKGRGKGIMVVAQDDGPGIRNVDQVMQVGYSTSGSLGLGLPGARRLMDEFHITSKLGKGTTVTMTKWKRQ